MLYSIVQALSPSQFADLINGVFDALLLEKKLLGCVVTRRAGTGMKERETRLARGKAQRAQNE